MDFLFCTFRHNQKFTNEKSAFSFMLAWSGMALLPDRNVYEGQ